ncbi:hypothetical protein CLV58_11027 [Spirosoma oryzae]|uniref:Uncharacterized protein n=1 Tax=Spirosoma oryzae TaxID=1469603 RepID=A0A2T0SVX6_9BACT|nr:hypothetical protein [Spirosoma oryzae]PRY37558.1 hypothetical protein CLV58_11027 [Spirosoma oryzae]
MSEQPKRQKAFDYYVEEVTDTVTRYLLNANGALFVFENVPARVNRVTGEQLFAPATVRRIQQIAMSTQKPDRIVQAKVYDWQRAA